MADDAAPGAAAADQEEHLASPPSPPLPPRASSPPPASASADSSAERLASIKDRLSAISSKHSTRRKSTESVSVYSQRLSGTTFASQSIRSSVSPTPSDPETLIFEQLALSAQQRRASLADLTNRLRAGGAVVVSSIKPRDANCTCTKVIPLAAPEEAGDATSPGLQAEPALCQSCSSQIRPIFKIVQERSRLLEQMVEVRSMLDQARSRDDNTTRETARLLGRVEELEDLMDSKAEDVQRLRKDLSAMSEKVVDEIEKRAELQASKDVLQDELEELTKSLFEQANVLVADEARRRHIHEVREKSLEQDVAEVKLQLQREQLQLRELKAKMEEQQLAELQESSYDAIAGAADGSIAQNFNDPMLLAEFTEFISAAPTVKSNRLHTLAFMKNALEDDVAPCLRFGANPRTSTRRLIDAIAAGSCFVEEMSPAQMAVIQSQHQAIRDAQAAAAAAAEQNRARPFIQSYAQSVPYAAPVSAPRGASMQGIRSGSPAAPPLPASHFLLPEREKQLQAIAASPTQAIFQKTMLERISTWTGSGTKATGATTSASAGEKKPAASGAAATTATQAGSATGAASAAAPAGAVPNPIQLPPSLVLSGCSTCGRTPIATPHQFKITDSPDDHFCPICQACRDRLAAVCEFYAFVRSVRKGVYSSRRPEDLLADVFAIKRRMFYARIGCAKMADGGGAAWLKMQPAAAPSVVSAASGAPPVEMQPPLPAARRP